MIDAGATWTDERVEQLRKLWGEGLSASQIAAQIGGVSRNAVIGKVHRLGLSGRGKAPAAPVPAAPAASAPPAAKPRPKGLPQAPRSADTELEFEASELETAPATPPEAQPQRREVAIPPSQRVTIMELRESMCRWPIGDPTNPEFRFCGGRAITGLPYCTEHAQIAYQPAADRRRDRRFVAA